MPIADSRPNLGDRRAASQTQDGRSQPKLDPARCLRDRVRRYQSGQSMMLVQVPSSVPGMRTSQFGQILCGTALM
jgi:hypothetical protein